MSLSTLNYTKDWTNAEDFPTVQTDENQVRADQQFLFNEIKAYLNDTLIPGIESAIAIACQDLVVGQLTDGSVTKNKLSEALINVISRAELGGDLDARINTVSSDKVSKAGDTMNGNFSIQRDYPQITLKSPLAGRDSYVAYVGNEKNLFLMNRLDANNRQGVYITPETSSLSNAVRLMRVVGGDASYYSLLHTGNLSDLGVARIATGSYVGTGTYGESNPTILSAGFPPKALFIVREGYEIFCSQYEWEESGIWIQGARGFSQTRNSPVTVVTANGNTLSMYSTSSSYDQLNDSGKTYHYVILG